MVFDSVARYYAELHAEDGGQGSLPHVIISNLEHDSVDLTTRKMEEMGRVGKYQYNNYIMVSTNHKWPFVSIILKDK